MSEPLRIGVIGGGLVAQRVHLPLLAQMSDLFTVRALADPSTRVREGLAARYGLTPHTDWRSMIEAGGLDAVVVCSPQPNHAEATLGALDAGIHVLVEKPLCIDVADADAICRRRAETGLVVLVGYMKRYDSAVDRLLEGLTEDPADLRLIEVVTRDPGMARAPFTPADFLVADDVPAAVIEAGREAEREQVEAATGRGDPDSVRAFNYTFLACLVHDINLIHACLGRLGVELPLPATGSAHWSDGKGATVAYRLPGGGIWNCSWLLLEGLEDFLEDAALYFAGGVHRVRFAPPYMRERPTLLDVTRAEEGVELTVASAHGNDGFAAELRHLHACITTGAEPRTPPEQGRLDLIALRDAFLAGPSGTRASG